MNRKILLASVILLTFAFVLSQQISLVSSAYANTPVTGPVTSFTKTISGIVNYKFVGFLRKNKPTDKRAEGVSIEARNMKTDETFNTITDANGEYSLNVPAGHYAVRASKDNISFIPSVRAVNVKKADEKTANFKGVVFANSIL